MVTTLLAATLPTSAVNQGFPILSFIVAMPALAALILLFVPNSAKQAIRGIALAGATLSLAGAVYVFVAYYRLGEHQLAFAERYELVPSLGIEYFLAVDGWGAVLLLLTGIIIYAGVWASWGLEERQREFFIFLLVLVAGVYGVFVSLDLFVFFVFYEIAVLPMYLLIGIWGSVGKVAEAGPFRWAFRMLDVGGKEYAAMKLTLMLLIGSAFILASMLGMYWEAGGQFDMLGMADVQFSWWLQMLAFPALWIGFGTLGGLWPFHTWSPDGHAAAPTAVSMLHAGVLMKLGAFGVIRVGMMLLPEGAEAWAMTVGTVAVINVVWGAFAAMAQKDLKYIIAYSSVSHMGVVLLGAATLTANGWNGAIFQMFAHGVMTGLFFALVGLVYGRTHDRMIPHMGGFAAIMPLTAAFFTLAGLSSLGLPGTAGFIAEFLVFLGAWQSGYWWWAIPGAVGAFITAVYVLRATKIIFWGEGPPSKFVELTDAQPAERVALFTLGACIVLFGLWPRALLDLIDGATLVYLTATTGAVAGVLP
jgi:NADH-quinone oxidoreductase subunit M